MSARKHLERAVQILRDKYEDQIIRDGDWYWNLKKWTINFITDPDFESITAYKVVDGATNWSEYITLEMREKQWKELV